MPYEEDHSRGKDRPVLLVGRDGPWLLGVPLTSKDHDRDAAQEARWGRFWHDVGTGDWDRQGRPSEVRLDRLRLVEPASVRREGATMKREVLQDAACWSDELTCRRQVFRWLVRYNTKRRHSWCRYTSPVAFETGYTATLRPAA